MTLYCSDPLRKGCGWSGDPQELVAATEALGDTDFSHCPHCYGSEFDEEDEDEEEGAQ